MRDTPGYLAKIAPEHQGAPKFVATVALTVDVLARLQVFLASIPDAFDLDLAIGVQLDAVGLRVGITRRVPVPLPDPWFSLDDPLRGLDRGVWKGPYDTGSVLDLLDDDTFRRLIRAKILANRWDGTIAGEQAIFDAYFIDPATQVFVSDATISAPPPNYFSLDDPARGLDNSVWAPVGYSLAGSGAADMRMNVGVSGKIPSVVDLAIMAQGLIGAKPAGVTVNYLVTSKNNAPVFGLDADNEYIGGLDHGAWGVAPAYLLAKLPA